VSSRFYGIHGRYNISLNLPCKIKFERKMLKSIPEIDWELGRSSSRSRGFPVALPCGIIPGHRKRPGPRTRTREDLTTRQYRPLLEFLAGYRSTLLVAAGSRRMNKARVTRQLEKSLPRIRSSPSCNRIRSESIFGCVSRKAEVSRNELKRGDTAGECDAGR
jgi:hypothetical protein